MKEKYNRRVYLTGGPEEPCEAFLNEGSLGHHPNQQMAEKAIQEAIQHDKDSRRPVPTRGRKRGA
jgi:hypothetical protein